MKQWHRHLVLCERAKREGGLARRKPLAGSCYHYWQLYDHDKDLFRCRCGATISSLALADSRK